MDSSDTAERLPLRRITRSSSIVSSHNMATRPRIGRLVASTQTLANSLGRPTTVRRSLAVESAPVRYPQWLLPTVAGREDQLDQWRDRDLIAIRRARSKRRVVRQAPPRGLPMASHAQGRSRLGDSTAPSSIARRLQPVRRLPNQNDAHGSSGFAPPTRAASPRPPRSRRIALPAGKSGDRDGPAPAPGSIRDSSVRRSTSSSTSSRTSSFGSPKPGAVPRSWPSALWSGVSGVSTGSRRTEVRRSTTGSPRQSSPELRRVDAAPTVARSNSNRVEPRRTATVPRHRSEAPSSRPVDPAGTTETSRAARGTVTGSVDSTASSVASTPSVAPASSGSTGTPPTPSTRSRSTRPEWTVLRSSDGGQPTSTSPSEGRSSRVDTTGPDLAATSERPDRIASSENAGLASSIRRVRRSVSTHRPPAKYRVARRVAENPDPIVPGPILPGWRRVVGLPEPDVALDSDSAPDPGERPSLAERVARLADDTVRRSTVTRPTSSGSNRSESSSTGSRTDANYSESLRRSLSTARPPIGVTLARSIATGGAVGAVARTVAGRQVGAPDATRPGAARVGSPRTTDRSGGTSSTVRRSSTTSPAGSAPGATASVTGAGADAARSFRERMERRGIVMPEPDVDSPSGPSALFGAASDAMRLGADPTVVSGRSGLGSGAILAGAVRRSPISADSRPGIEHEDAARGAVRDNDRDGVRSAVRAQGSSAPSSSTAQASSTASRTSRTGPSNAPTSTAAAVSGSTSTIRRTDERVQSGSATVAGATESTSSWRRDGAAIGTRGVLRRSVRGPRPARRRAVVRLDELPVAPSLARGADPAPSTLAGPANRPGSATLRRSDTGLDPRPETRPGDSGLVGDSSPNSSSRPNGESGHGASTHQPGDSIGDVVRRSPADERTPRRVTVRRARDSADPNGTSRRSSSGDTSISADDMARMIEAGFEPTPNVVTRRVAGLSSSPVRRSPSSDSGSGTSSASRRPGSLVIRRAPAALDSMAPGPVSILSQVLQSSEDIGESGMSVTTSQLLDLVDWINRTVDERLRLELERRGVNGARW